MKTLQKYRNVLALGLILILLPVFAVRSFHFHSEKEHIHVEKNSSESVDGVCKICDFVFAPFEENDNSVEIVLEHSFVIYQAVIVLKPIFDEVFVNSLRAPPAFK